MRHASRVHRAPLLGALTTLAVAVASSAAAQGTPTPAPTSPASTSPAPASPASASPASGQPAAHAGHGAAPAADVALRPEDVTALARLAVAIGVVRDSTQRQLSMVRHKTPEAQRRLRDQGAEQVTALLKSAGLTTAEYGRRTYRVSTDSSARRLFDQTVAQLTAGAGGAGTPAQAAAEAAAPSAPATAVKAGEAPAMAAALPAGPLGAHLGHVLQSFAEAPEKRGLLPTALAEAKVAAAHAALAMRDPMDLAKMKQHAAHVLHAVDPSKAPMGPGLGYGVKRAAEGVAQHVELAGAVQGVAPEVTTHASHVATSARNTARRADEIAALVQKIQSAGSAADAAGLVSQLSSLTAELTSGRDVDADGRIDWKPGEGGLQQAEQHAKLLVTATAKP